MLNEYNMIFLGSIKTLYLLQHLLSESHFRVEIAPHKIIYTPEQSDSLRAFETALHSEGPNDDLVLALKLKGPKNNPVFIIGSFHSLGAPAIATYLAQSSTRQAVINAFMAKYQRFPEYFEILFRVTGIDKTAYKSEMLLYNEITPD